MTVFSAFSFFVIEQPTNRSFPVTVLASSPKAATQTLSDYLAGIGIPNYTFTMQPLKGAGIVEPTSEQASDVA